MNEQNQKPMVLFLCTGNSARSQMAEAILRREAGDRFEVRSAGLDPTQVHPFTIRALTEIGVDASDLYAKHVREFLGRASVRYAIIVCEKVQQNCPRIFPFAFKNLYWPFDDPTRGKETEPETMKKFREVRDQIQAHIKHWLQTEEPR